MVESISTSLQSYAAQVRERIDAALDSYTQLGDGCPAQLREAIRYSLLSGGKRLRPMLVLLAAEACGGSADAALPAAAAIEMVHTYSLVHDDLPAMDDDDLRRGRPTCHKAFGEATAILVGDALLALAFDVLARDVQPPALAAKCCAVLARAAGATELVGGQADDLAGVAEHAGVEALESIHRRKTGAMFLAALELGGRIGGGDSRQRAALEAFGKKLGLAFQITDDLLDVAGSTEALGKRAGKDREQGKLTFPVVLGVEESRRRAQRLIDEAAQALAPLAPRAEGLEALARYVLERNH
jgi:geranylgeranyl diphosphate synthase, type II